MNDPRNSLGPLAAEKAKLRRQGIKLKEIHHQTVDTLQEILNVSEIRARELIALSEFQSIPSVGIRFAHDLISLGYYSLKELRGKSPAKLVDRLEAQMGVWIDPCVEDQFRLATHYAEHPGSFRNWWDFTAERKSFRQKHGYPPGRPKKPWHELEQYQQSNRIQGGAETKKDLSSRLKLAVKFIQKNLQEDITLAEMADKANLSPFHFHRLFKKVYEATPLQYLTHVRMKQARKLLAKSRRPVHAIGTACGFENQSSFIRLFKQKFGWTPLDFRKSIVTLKAKPVVAI